MFPLLKRGVSIFRFAIVTACLGFGVLTVSDGLDDTVFNVPVTFRRLLPSGWTSATVTQNGKAVPSSVAAVNSVPYVVFDAVPDAGAVVISQSGGGGSDTVPPGAPTGLTAAAAGSTAIALDWAGNSEPDLAGYNVYRGGIKIASVASSGHDDTGLSPGTAYTYTVTAVDASGNESTASAPAAAATDASGTAVLATAAKTKPDALTFCVDSITHATLSYDPAANLETCASAP